MDYSISNNISSFLCMMKILIIEDEAIIAMDLARIFYSLGAREIKVVSSAEEGLTWINKDRPDLVIVDIKLRGSMDGIEAAKIIQRKGPFRLIYITAYNDEATLNRASQIPNLGIITKPFTLNEVLKFFPHLNS